MSFGTTSTKEIPSHVVDIVEKSEKSEKLNTLPDKDTDSIASSEHESEVEISKTNTKDWLTYFTWFIYMAIWITLYFIALELQFGGVYFILSCFVAIYLNMREKPKRAKEISAYSVFNENCQSIDGTFNAEMFERQLGVRKM